MTVNSIREAVQTIASYAVNDPERAHALEDDLYEEFARSLVQDPDSPDWVRILAREVLKSKKIHFFRRCYYPDAG